MPTPSEWLDPEYRARLAEAAEPLNASVFMRIGAELWRSAANRIRLSVEFKDAAECEHEWVARTLEGSICLDCGSVVADDV